MNTTMDNEVVVGSEDAQPSPRPTPTSGSTDPHQFREMRVRQRAARTRRRRLKRGGMLLGLAAVAFGGWWMARGHRGGREAVVLAVPASRAAPVLAVTPVEVVPAAMPAAVVQT